MLICVSSGIRLFSKLNYITMRNFLMKNLSFLNDERMRDDGNEHFLHFMQTVPLSKKFTPQFGLFLESFEKCSWQFLSSINKYKTCFSHALFQYLYRLALHFNIMVSIFFFMHSFQGAFFS